MEKIKWPEKVSNEQVLGRIGEKRTLRALKCSAGGEWRR